MLWKTSQLWLQGSALQIKLTVDYYPVSSTVTGSDTIMVMIDLLFILLFLLNMH